MEQSVINLLSKFCELLERIDSRLKRLENLEKQRLENTHKPKSRLVIVNDWQKYHSYPSTSGLRKLIFFADTNGANKFIRRVGRRILICEKSFFEWVEKNNKASR